MNQSRVEIPTGPYVIPEAKTLIIVDAHDTILQRDLRRSTGDVFGDPRQRERIQWRPREGLLNFIEYFSGLHKKRIVISSDGGRQKLRGIFRRFGIDRQLAGVYGGEHLHRETYLKQLDLIMTELGATPGETVFIGDSRIDMLSAEKYGVDFIGVPSGEDFSFNAFIRLDFTADRYGLEIQRLTNARKVFHNQSTPELVEAALARGEGRLTHLGPLAVNAGADRAADISGANGDQHTALYVVREPSSESEVDWGGAAKPYSSGRFQRLSLRLQAFLQDRDLFIQDCFAGADPRRRFPLRVITMSAWHGLYARNTFIQARPAELADFFPEYTVVHVPQFHAIPEVDGTRGSAFVILNLARKLAFIGGTERAGEIRFAAFNLLGYFFTQADVLPLRCSSNHDGSGRLSLFIGRASLARSSLAFAPDRSFFGGAHHCWTEDGFFNMEWGCYEPVTGLKQSDSPALFEITRRFGSLLENAMVTPGRRVDLQGPGPTPAGTRASFPITHLERADRSGRAGQPRDAFILVSDATGALPGLARLSAEQAVLFLLAGLTEGEGPADFAPFFGELPAVFPPAVYALLFWQKLKASDANCWLLNIAPRKSAGTGETPRPAELVAAVHAGFYSNQGLRHDPFWKFELAVATPDKPDGFGSQEAQGDSAAAREKLRALLKTRIDPFREQLDRELLRALPVEAP